MRTVGWVCHHDMLGNVIGGAEMADKRMVDRKPEDVHITVIRPGSITKAIRQYDAVVVTRSEFLDDRDIDILLLYSEPTVWAHGFQKIQAPHAKELFESCKNFIALTPEHLKREQEWLEMKSCLTAVNPGWMDVDEFPPLHLQGSEEFAVWAARNEPHKGLDRAEEWSHNTGIPLIVHIDSPRNVVIRHMARAKYFVLLSNIFDAGPLSVIEAQLCGCELVLDNVGYFDWEQGSIRTYINQCDKLFWEVLL